MQLITIPTGTFVEITNVDNSNGHNNNNNDNNSNKYAIVIGHEEMKENWDFEWNLHIYKNLKHKKFIQYGQIYIFNKMFIV